MSWRSLFLFFSAVSQQLYVISLDNGVGMLPAMGVNTWNSLRCDGISAENIKAYADKLIQLGLKDRGYVYVNIDDCWSVGRDESTQKLLPDPKAFPNGMREVADYVHSKGLKLGIYGDRGVYTCEARPGSLGYEDIDAQTYAEWGIDYLKEDSCYATTVHSDAKAQYGAMRDALNRTGRPILFSLCGWNAWYASDGKSLGNSWRIGADSDDWVHIYVATRTNEQLAEFAGNGGFNDPDMLVSSNPKDAIHITQRQQRTQFSLWVIMTAPLLIGSNVLHCSDHDLDTFMNAQAIEINQDKLAIQGTVIRSTCTTYTIREQNFFKPWFYPHRTSTVVIQLSMAIVVVCSSFAACIVFCMVRSRKRNVRSLAAQGAEPSLIEMQNSRSGVAVTDSDNGFMQRTKRCCRSGICKLIGVVCLGILASTIFAIACYWWATLDSIEGCQQIWYKPLSANDRTDAALLLMNWARTDANVTCDESCLRAIGFPDGVCVQDVWAHDGAPRLWQQSISEEVPGDGGSFLFRLTRSKKFCTTIL